MTKLENYNNTIFERIKHTDEEGNEYWEGRELQKILGYKEWRYFVSVIEKAVWQAIITSVPILVFTPKLL